MRSGRGNRSRQTAQGHNDTAGAVRIRFEDDSPPTRTALEAVKERLLRPGFLVALIATIAVAAVSLLTGYPLSSSHMTTGPRASSSEVQAAPSAARAPGVTAAKPLPSGPRFLDADDSGRLAYAGGNLNEALARFKAAYDRNPSDAESMSNAAQILVRLGRAEEAVPLLRRAIELNGNRWAYRFNLARVMDQLGQIDQAIEQYEAAATLFPDDYATLFNLGRSYHRQGNDTAAIERYRRAIALNPQEPTFHFAMALSLERMGRNADATASYERFLELSPGSPEADRVRVRIGELQSGGRVSAAAASTTPADEKASIK